MSLVWGLLIGLAVGATGIGAGVLCMPVLVLWFGVPATEAVAMALLFGTVVKLKAGVWFLWRRQVSGAVLWRLALGGLPGAILGSMLLRGLARSGAAGLLLTLLGAIIVLSAGISLLRAVIGAAPAQPRPGVLPWLAFPIGASVGFSSAGGGVLGCLLMLRFTALAPVEIVGTDLVFGILLSAVGGGLNALFGGWNTPILIGLTAGGVAGAACGAWAAARLPVRALRFALLTAALALGGLLLHTGITKLAQG